jgi:hypothetical protein
MHPLCIARPTLPLAVYTHLNTAPQAKLTVSILKTGFTSSTIDPTALQPQSIQLFPNLLIDFSLILINQLY